MKKIEWTAVGKTYNVLLSKEAKTSQETLNDDGLVLIEEGTGIAVEDKWIGVINSKGSGFDTDTGINVGDTVKIYPSAMGGSSVPIDTWTDDGIEYRLINIKENDILSKKLTSVGTSVKGFTSTTDE
jgi:hypothetical protein